MVGFGPKLSQDTQWSQSNLKWHRLSLCFASNWDTKRNNIIQPFSELVELATGTPFIKQTPMAHMRVYVHMQHVCATSFKPTVWSGRSKRWPNVKLLLPIAVAWAPRKKPNSTEPSMNPQQQWQRKFILKKRPWPPCTNYFTQANSQKS